MSEPRPRETDAELQARIDSVPVWYHAIELRPGCLSPGIYDLRNHLEAFEFPDSLAGKRAIDIGAANGYFSFHFESLGAAQVVAVDLPSILDHDAPDWYRAQQRARHSSEELKVANHLQLEAGFALAHEVLGSKVEKRRLHVRDVGAQMPKAFDFAFLGNLLHHLRDPVEALESVRECLAPGGQLVVSCCCDISVDQSYAVFSGCMDEVMWWVMSPKALIRMCLLAGFSEPRWIGSFEFATSDAPDHKGTMGVLHATAPEQPSIEKLPGAVWPG